MILSLRVLPSLGIAVEEATRPQLGSHPIVLGGLPHQRGSVREINQPAQAAGVEIGMTLAQAYHHCPDGAFLLPDLPRYERIWQSVCVVLGEFAPVVEPVALGQAVCDLTGCERQWRDVCAMARRLLGTVRQRTGLWPSLGLGSNRLVAEVASLRPGPDGMTIVPDGQERAFLAETPLATLPDVDARLALTFQVLGLRTAGQLAALPARAVEQRFGALGKRLHAMARGIDGRRVVAPPEAPAVAADHRCGEGDLDEALAVLRRLAHSCAAELERRSLAGRLLELTLRWDEDTPLPAVARVCNPPVARVCNPPVAQVCNPPAAPDSLPPSTDADVALPVAYRIHSMLPQPAHPHPPAPSPARARGGEERSAGSLCPPSLLPSSTVALRTPVRTAAAIFEPAQRLLLQRWQPQRRLDWMQLRVSQFEEPTQLSFPELIQLNQTGGLAGLSPARRQALAEQEAVLAARYHAAPFRHLAQVDPDSVLTERRFRWANGLSFPPPIARSSRPLSPKGISSLPRGRGGRG